MKLFVAKVVSRNPYCGRLLPNSWRTAEHLEQCGLAVARGIAGMVMDSEIFGSRNHAGAKVRSALRAANGREMPVALRIILRRQP